VPYSAATGQLYQLYLAHRRELSRERGLVFLSESRRNRAAPVTIWTWSKVVRRWAEQSGIAKLTTHTFRHLCLTDLARAGWDVHEIARFAGHRSYQSTLTYIHLSGHDLAAKVAAGVNEIHAWRVQQLLEAGS
jgi:integrase/recombinase XerD